MRQFYNDNGYVWIKNVIPREAVWDMREHFLAQLKSTGILRPGTSPRDGIFNPVNDPLAHQGIGGTPEAQVLSMLDEVHQTPTYRAFTAHPAFRSFIRIHYDKYFLRGGEADFLTAWVPIGDCAPEGGGLMDMEAEFMCKAEHLRAEERMDAFNPSWQKTGSYLMLPREMKMRWGG